MESGFKSIKVAFLLLCHDRPEYIIRQLSMQYFQNENVKVYLHYDASKSDASYDQLVQFAKTSSNVDLIKDRVACKWGEYSLVDATQKMMRAGINDASFKADYFFLISDSCIPIRPFQELQQFLYVNPEKEFIEATDISKEQWVKDGLEIERCQYYFPFNFLSQRTQFDKFTHFQRSVGIKRKKPKGIQIHFGSQWFCITRKSANHVVERLGKPNIERFFKHSWIPDEFAIQSLIASFIPSHQIAGKNLTYFQFNSMGKPVVLYNDHFEMLTKQNFFFARKVSKEAKDLYKMLDLHTSQKFTGKVLSPNKLGDKGLHHSIYLEFNISPDRGSKIGRTAGNFGGGLDKNYKKFTVLTGISRPFIREVTKRLRQLSEEKYVVYDYLFEIDYLDPTSNGNSFMGISKKDLKRRDYDPVAFLYQIINSSDKHVIFCIDNYDLSQINNVLRWCHEASVIIVEPFGHDKIKQIVTSLSQDEIDLLEGIKTEELPNAIYKLYEMRNNYFWDYAFRDESHASVRYLNDANGPLPDKLKEIYKRVQPSSYLSSTLLNILNCCDSEVES